jgi:hypothetical protein
VTKAILVARFLRARAWWRLDSAGASALQVARSVVALLNAAAYLQDIPDDDPDLLALEAAGCFRGGVFDPGSAGADIIRRWQLGDIRGLQLGDIRGLQLGDGPTAGPRELLAELVRAALLDQVNPASRADVLPSRSRALPRDQGNATAEQGEVAGEGDAGAVSLADRGGQLDRRA